MAASAATGIDAESGSRLSRFAVVTGASSGIGRETCIHLAAAGWSVVIHFGKNHEGAEATAKQCAETALDASIQAFPIVTLDLAAFAGRGRGPALLDACKEAAFGAARHGRTFDALVNNAAVYMEMSNDSTDPDEWEDVWSTTIAINLTAAASIARAFAADMANASATKASSAHPAAISSSTFATEAASSVTTAAAATSSPSGATHSGTIVNITSRGAFRGEPCAVAYGATKAGLNSVTQSLAKSFGHKGVAVVAVAPGFVDTPMAAAALAPGPVGDAIKAQSPFGRVASVGDVAHTVAFLADGKSHFLSGTIVDVNGASYFR